MRESLFEKWLKMKKNSGEENLGRTFQEEGTVKPNSKNVVSVFQELLAGQWN